MIRIFTLTNRLDQFSKNFPNYKNYFADKNMVGPPAGNTFEAISLDDGAIVKEIKVWMTDNLIHGILVKMSNNQRHWFGLTTSKPKITTEKNFIFQKWERITSLTIGYDTLEQHVAQRGGSLRYIVIQTDADRTFELGTEYKHIEKKKHSEYKYDVGSGICFGIFGYHDENALYSIGFAMLDEVESTILSNMKYLSDTNHQEIIPEVIKTLEFSNNSDETQQEKYKISAVETTTKTWNSGWTVGTSATAKFQAGIPSILPGSVKVEGSATGSASYNKGKLDTLTNTATHEYEWTLSIPPKKRLTATGRINNTKLETNFEADMKVILENGQEVCYKEKGTFSETSRKDVWLEVNQEDIEEKKG